MTETRFTPIGTNDRITTLDVIRGVALFGILLMNVEFFNRPISQLDIGLPGGITGIDFWAGWFVHVFIRSKFWTMFSLLFGMGFAVMLGRAQAAGRPFLAPYVRRTLALALFGFLHCVFLWNGDILFDYAMAAAFLLIVFHARPKVLLWVAGIAFGVAAVSGAAYFLGHEQKIWAPSLALGGPVLVLGVIACAIGKWPANGLRNAGLVLFLLPCVGLLIGGLATPQTTQAQRDRAALVDAKTPEERAELKKSLDERAKAYKEHDDKVATERRLNASGTYADNVAFRLREWPQDAVSHIPFSLTFVLGMFLIGAWFIRSGLMTQPAAYLDFYRKMALFGIPFGIGLSIVGAAIASTHVRGINDALFTFSQGLMLIASLPACLGYVAAIVLMFHSPRLRGFVAPFAQAGRMALSVYISMSVVGTLFFYGYGLGHYGMGRAWQLLWCVAVFAVLLVLANLWLKRFRYGPLEWTWRAITYLRAPSMRQERLAPA
ncbi:DUF418 domain-containing protein [Lysobacter sp. 2RAF19]